jgi:enamine deaminase RidA (YjgF/YER057c/UK114 family)
VRGSAVLKNFHSPPTMAAVSFESKVVSHQLSVISACAFGDIGMGSQVEERLKALGVTLPTPPEAVGFYVPVLRTGNLVVTSGQLPMIGKQVVFTGKVGADVTEQDGFNAAAICAQNALAQIKACIGDLDRVTRIVRVEGYVQSAPGFSDQPFVVNGASELLVEAFGEAGRHTRCAVGVAELPLNAAVEVAVWAEVS